MCKCFLESTKISYSHDSASAKFLLANLLVFEIAAVSLAVKNSESVKLTLSGKSFRVQLFSESSAVTAKCNAKQEQKRNSIMKMFMWNCGPRYIYIEYAVKLNRRQAVILR